MPRSGLDDHSIGTSMSRITSLRLAAVLFFSLPTQAQAPDAATLIKTAIEYWRDTSSYAVSEMTIHRPDWERRVTFQLPKGAGVDAHDLALRVDHQETIRRGINKHPQDLVVDGRHRQEGARRVAASGHRSGG